MSADATEAAFDWAEERIGPLVAIDELGGQSRSDVWRLKSDARTAILKAAASTAEADFYADVAPRLEAASIDVPCLYGRCRTGGASWILIEDVARALPKSRWDLDRDVIAYLRRLHAFGAGDLPILHSTRTFAWERSHSHALEALCASTPEAVEVIERARTVAPPILEAVCFVHGDPNRTNWAVRDHGALVAFDWERHGFATPALDLAITVAGLGTRRGYEELARVYRADGSRADPCLSRDIAAAKVWVLAQFLGDIASGAAQPFAGVVDWLTTEVPRWLLTEVASSLARAG